MPEDDALQSAIGQDLRRLTQGLGVRRKGEALVEAFRTQLRELAAYWELDLSKSPEDVRQDVTDKLLFHIAQLAPRNANQENTSPERQDQYQFVAKVGFNIVSEEPACSELAARVLMERHEWVELGAPPRYRMGARTSQRELKHAIAQIERQILNAQSNSQASTLVDAEAEESSKATPGAESQLPGDEVVLRQHRDTNFDTLISRPFYLNKLFELFVQPDVEGLMPLCIWGEAGTGKTTLAQQFFGVLFESQTDAMPVATLRAGDPAQLREDVTSLLVFEGKEPTNWDDSYAWSVVRRTFSGESPNPPRVRAIIIDNVEDEGLIAQLVPTGLRVPFLITMRSKPREPRVASLQIQSFDEAQALAFIKKMLGDVDETDARALSWLLGGRPLTLDHATRFICDSPDIKLRDVVTTLSRRVTDGLELLSGPVDPNRSLVEFYKLILASLVENENIRYFLDAFLAICGATGAIQNVGLYDFLGSKYGGSRDRVQLRSALQMLASRGLIRETTVPYDIEKHIYLTMHALTFAVLRDLRGLSVLMPVEAKYFMHLSSPAVLDYPVGDDLPENDQNVGRAHSWTRAVAVQAMRDNLPPGWMSLLNIDQSTWIATFAEDNEDGSEQHYVVRYEIRPDAMYKLDYRIGQWSAVTGEEFLTVFDAALRYQAAMHRTMDPLIDPSGEQQQPDPRRKEMEDFIEPWRKQQREQ